MSKNHGFEEQQMGGMRDMTAEEKYPLLIGHSLAGRTRLRNIQEVANFICTHGQYGDLRITQKDGTPFLDTFGIYINKITDMKYREELLKVLIPMQKEIDGTNKIDKTEERNMNKFEAERRFTQRMKDNYPPGTRIMLLQMGDDPRPIEPNTRGNYILNNERYMGDCLLQKSYTTESLPFTKKRNRGEKAQYYVENSNLAIVSRETYQAVQELQKSKSKGNHVSKNRYPFSGMLKCPVCGHNYRRQVVNGTAYWLCSYKAAGRTECAGDRVREDAVMSAFIRMSDKLAQNREELLGDLIRQLEKLQSRTSTSGEQVYQLNRQIADVNAQSLVVAQLYKNGVLNHAEYASRSGELDRKVSELRSERRRILTEDEDDEIIESLKELNETIAEYVPTDSFDADLFGQIVESITVIGRNTLRFRLAGGLTLTEKFEERSA